MCLAPKLEQPKINPEPAPPPPPPPAPAETATGLTVGSKRTDPPIKNFLRKSLGAQRNPLVIPIGGTDSAGAGLNVPR